MNPVPRHRAAIRRAEPSVPIKCLVRDGILERSQSFFDFGCGHGDDLQYVQSLGVCASGWDPVHRPHEPRSAADVVNLGFVLNVIEDPQEREDVLRDAWRLCRRTLSVAARIVMGDGAEGEIPYGDGVLTRIGTFQKYFAQSELREYLESVLGESAFPAAPGVFFVFRDEEVREWFLSLRYRRRRTPRRRLSEVRFEAHRELLDPLVDWVSERGRVPEPDEFDGAESLLEEFGSLRRAFALIRRVTGAEEWDAIARARSEDLLVYLALTSFRRRPRFSVLPVGLQRDIRAFFGSYKKACARADQLLFEVGDAGRVDVACRESPLGKLTENALWVHRDAVDELPILLRVFEGCARSYLGEVEEANLVKLHRFSGKVSYVECPEFETNPLPPIRTCLKLSLRSRRVDWYDDTERPDPMLVHGKDSVVGPGCEHYEKYRRLSDQHREWGLVAEDDRLRRRSEWASLHATYGLSLRGHRLVGE